MFKNLQMYRLNGFKMTADELAAALKSNEFTPASSVELMRQGWDSPRPNGPLVHAINGQYLLKLKTEKRLLPSSVINQVAKERAAEMEEVQGFAPGKKAMKEIKENVADELLPQAFRINTAILAWIDPINGWLMIDTASPSKADEVVKHLLKSVGRLPLESLRVMRSPVAAMTEWLQTDEAPTCFTIDQDATLRATGESKAQVQYKRHTLAPDDIGRHIAAGKQVTRLAMTWSDKISFVLDEGLTIKSIKMLDVLKETEASTKNDDERFDSDMALFTGELAKMAADLVDALGGEALTDAPVPSAPAGPAQGDEPVRKQSVVGITIKEFHPIPGDDFGAQHNASDWLSERGFSCGPSSVDGPQAIWHGDCSISKWRNLSADEQRDAHAIMSGKRGGTVLITLRAHAPAEAIAAFNQAD